MTDNSPNRLRQRKKARIAPPPLPFQGFSATPFASPPSPVIPPPRDPHPSYRSQSHAYGKRSVIKFDLPEPPDDEMPSRDLELGEGGYLLRDVTTEMDKQGSPRFQVMSPTSPKEEAESKPDPGEAIPLPGSLRPPIQVEGPSKKPTDYPEIWPEVSPTAQDEFEPLSYVTPTTPTFLPLKQVEMGDLSQQQNKVGQEIDELAEKLNQYKLDLDAYDLKRFEEDKRLYVRAKLNPTDPKEKAKLEHSVKIYSYQGLDELQRKQEAENKRAQLQAKFEREFEEYVFLKDNESNVIEAFTDLNFKKPELKASIFYLLGGGSTCDFLNKHNEKTIAARRAFKAKHRDEILLDVLKQVIRQKLTPQEVEALDCLENIQEDMNKLSYKARTSQLPDYQAISDARKAKKQAKPFIEQLCKERQILGSERNSVPLLEVQDGERRKALLLQFTTLLATTRTKLRTCTVNPETGEPVARDERTKQPFMPLGSKPK